MKVKAILIAIVTVILIGIAGFFILNNYIYNEKQGDPMTTTQEEITIPQVQESIAQVSPITHASFVLNMSDQVIYNDPTGGVELYAAHPAPNIILVSDIHGDHMDPDTLNAVSESGTTLIVPQAVKDELPEGIPGNIIVMNNGDKIVQSGIEIEAIPMYNVPETEGARHTRGRGNGYILSNTEGTRIYIAGDTGPTPEMKALTDIDIAFIPMNPPFTMTVEEAADAVIAFKAKSVHPYHYRSPDGLQDVNKFKELVETGDPNISVEVLNFYPTTQ